MGGSYILQTRLFRNSCCNQYITISNYKYKYKYNLLNTLVEFGEENKKVGISRAIHAWSCLEPGPVGLLQLYSVASAILDGMCDHHQENHFNDNEHKTLVQMKRSRRVGPCGIGH